MSPTSRSRGQPALSRRILNPDGQPSDRKAASRCGGGCAIACVRVLHLYLDYAYTKPQEQRIEEDEQIAEVCRLLAELKRLMMKRDILKRDAAYFARAWMRRTPLSNNQRTPRYVPHLRSRRFRSHSLQPPWPRRAEIFPPANQSPQLESSRVARTLQPHHGARPVQE